MSKAIFASDACRAFLDHDFRGSAEPCEDAISRQAALDKAVYTETEEGWSGRTVDVKDIEALPPVTPQTKMGRWLAKSFHEVYCDNCGFDFDIMTNEFIDKMKYCPNCGADGRGCH